MSKLDLASIRERLNSQSGPTYWRSLEELAGDPEFEKFLHSEFPREASVIPDGASAVDRRSFLQLMGASLALGGAVGCTRQPVEKIVPAVKAPESVPGVPRYFATATPFGGYGFGVLAESHEGRPTKLEGNPDHPASLGATDARTQASILTLYDPDRSQVVRQGREIRPWSACEEAILGALEIDSGRDQKDVRILMGPNTSPTMAAMLADICSRRPAVGVHAWDPVDAGHAKEGAKLAFDRDIISRIRVNQADTIVAFDADFLSEGPEHVRHIRELASRRRPGEGVFEPLRLYVAESSFSNSGAAADERIALAPSEVEVLLEALAGSLGVGSPVRGLPERQSQWLAALVHDLEKSPGKSLILAGSVLPPHLHALAFAINQRLGNLGTTMELLEDKSRYGLEVDSLESLATDMQAGRVHTLFILESNPAYDAPAGTNFAAAMAQVPVSFHLGLYDDETAALATWHIPGVHYLETWSDIRSGDGTISIGQPLIAPLYDGKSSLEVLGLLLEGRAGTAFQAVRSYWSAQSLPIAFESAWNRSLQNGVVAESAFPVVDVAAIEQPARWRRVTSSRKPAELTATFRPHPVVGDGSMANNGWLQECPAPLTKVTWNNPILISPATAESLGLSNGDDVELTVDGQQARGPVWILPGQPANVLGLQFGYGRRRAGKVGTSRGFNAYSLRKSVSTGFSDDVRVRATGERSLVASTQDHGSLEGRDIVRWASVEEYEKDPAFAQHMGHTPGPDDTLYPKFPYEGHAWGMTIDTSSCVGCNACVVGCQAENNIPIVGPEQIAMGREMQWMRIDRYWTGEPEEPETHYQPMLCQHCENAPCEVVCPVNATVHDSEGLNLMVYNRCVGTRYCSNNCPYKVRRFNFYLNPDWDEETLALQRNPDVTVRSRGVMEKCTYCIQRVNESRSKAKNEGREIADGDIKTACQQVCPAEAITFGDINDPESAVSKQRANDRNYGVLAELNTRPRTTYLAEVRNPSPALTKPSKPRGGHS
ncbi:TAT-variant-translocated molybdopterin oxidoreductase [Candidatus Binatia bacterium]|nr:TAT-variant-translocated molybdopterin oxidoreductase [Candidatus Binatia bacterium]